MKEMLTQSQWRYIRHWLFLLILAEGLMLVFHPFLEEMYIIVAILFLGGFLLRVFRLYPGGDEPLILDASAVVLAALYAAFAHILTVSPWRFVLIFCSSGIILPHIAYILKEK